MVFSGKTALKMKGNDPIGDTPIFSRKTMILDIYLWMIMGGPTNVGKCAYVDPGLKVGNFPFSKLCGGFSWW